ncbi:MAG: glycosyltransferase family 39 protein [candidate division WWE3 bacterium]|nr:glycosyltransferase family 39 protein [candidate division WWE3 bacterium]
MVYFLIFLATLFPRVYKIGFDLFNTDAFFWKENTYNFIGLFADHRFADMAITHHPGVTLMWLGGIGMKIFRGLYFVVKHVPAPNTQAVVLWTNFSQNLPIALVCTGAVAVSYYLIKRLFNNQRLALVTSLLLATEPWLVAHSRVYNTDALMTSFMFLSVLTLWLALLETKYIKWAVLSGVFAGLALLTKSISLFLIPFLLLSVGAFVIFKKLSIKKAMTIVSTVVAACVATFLVVWPAMWTSPVSTLKLYWNGIFLEGDTRLNLHNMFGHPTMNPGPIFYPLAFLLRFTPELIAAFAIGLILLIKRINRREGDKDETSLFLLLSLGFIVFYMLEISLATKKLDRYLLPVVPFVALIASYAFVQLKKKILLIVLGVILAIRVIVLGIYQPDYLAYYNPLLGGPTAGYNFDGEWWGEGYHLVGSWINEKLEVRAVAAYDNRQLRPFVKDNIAVYDAGDKKLDANKVDLWVLKYKDGGRQGFQIIDTVSVAGYPMWGIYKKI